MEQYLPQILFNYMYTQKAQHISLPVTAVTHVVLLIAGVSRLIVLAWVIHFGLFKAQSAFTKRFMKCFSI